MEKQRGFTLVELLVTVSIIAVIASVAIPLYTGSVQKSARGEAMSELLAMMREQENLFANEYTYTKDLKDINYSVSSAFNTDSGRYSLSAKECDGGLLLNQCVLLTAKAVNAQLGDGDLTLNSQGTRTYNNIQGWLQ